MFIMFAPGLFCSRLFTFVLFAQTPLLELPKQVLKQWHNHYLSHHSIITLAFYRVPPITMSSTRQFLSRKLAPHLSGLSSSTTTASRPVALNRPSKRGIASIKNNVDTLIVGGGPIGLSTAYHLATHYRDNDGSGITIVERDPTYARSSATLSAGGIRQQVSRS